MQANKVQTTPFRMSENLGVLPVNEQACEALGTSLKDFLELEFEISIIEGRLRIEAVPSKNAASIDHNSSQGAAING